MKINYDEIEEKCMPEFKGGIGTMVAKMYVDPSIKIINGYLEPGSSIGMHAHDDSSETVYIISGTGKMIYEGAEEEMIPGAVSYCPKGHSHSLVNTGSEPLRFIGVVPTL